MDTSFSSQNLLFSFPTDLSPGEDLGADTAVVGIQAVGRAVVELSPRSELSRAVEEDFRR